MTSDDQGSPKAARPTHRALTTLIIVLSGSIIAGFLGPWVNAFDSLAHFRAHLAVLLLPAIIAAAVLRRPLPALLGLVCVGLAAATTLAYLLPGTGARASPASLAPSYRLLQMNLRYDAGDKVAALRRIAETLPDVVTLQEVTDEWRELFSRLGERYPYQFHCRMESDFFYSAILSRRPFDADDAGICRPKQGFAGRSIDFNGVAVRVVSVHLTWPWPYRQWRQIDALRPVLAKIATPPLLIAGDFNAAPWSAAVRRVAEISRTEVTPGVGPSWMHRAVPRSIARLAGLPIDNILTSPGLRVVSVDRLPTTTSDHLPLLATFMLPVALPEPVVEFASADTTGG